MSPSSILITGGAGYIGSVLTARLLQEGYSVTVLDTLQHRQPSLLGCFGHPLFRFIKGDAADASVIKKCLESVDVIIPLAALVGAPACDLHPSYAKLINFDAIQTLLKALRPHQRILFPNTNSGYGVAEKGDVCTEESPLFPSLCMEG